MKKLLRLFAAVLVMGMFIGCGNSPDGDGQTPTDGGPYGQMSDTYGPAGDGKSKRSY